MSRITSSAQRAALAAIALAIVPAAARAEDVKPREVQGIEILDRRGAAVPLDAKLTDQDGHTVTLGDYFDGTRPTLLVMAYYQCPMLCSMVLNGLETGIATIPWTPGKEYRVVTISFDGRDTVERARAKRESYLKTFARHVDTKGWDFLVGDPQTVKRIADSVGFQYRWDPDQEQFAHAAGLFVMTPQGKVSQVIPGISFPERTLRLAITEASEGKLGSTWDQILLLCYHYDPLAKSYVLAATRLMRAFGALTVVVLGTVLARFWRIERRRSALAA